MAETLKRKQLVGVCGLNRKREKKQSKVYIKYWFDEKLSIKMLNKIIINDFTSVQTTLSRCVLFKSTCEQRKTTNKWEMLSLSLGNTNTSKSNSVERKSRKVSFCVCWEDINFNVIWDKQMTFLSHCLAWPPH